MEEEVTAQHTASAVELDGPGNWARQAGGRTRDTPETAAHDGDPGRESALVRVLPPGIRCPLPLHWASEPPRTGGAENAR